MFKPLQIKRRASAILTACLTLIASTAIFAQETDEADEPADPIEEIVVQGTRATVQRSIDLKRNSTQIVDGLSAEEIGDIPALSIGDALETITGATAHRENGGATELSVRGLGPFLGTTVVNGREATNGGGDRAVNFSIFPSEMFNGVSIHKTQSAEYIEGAVSGQVHLDTKKPLVYGKRLLQANVKLAASPDEANIEGGQEYGSRATIAYIDQFDFDSGARLGVSLGVQVRDETNPEQEYTTTSGGGRLEACELTSFDSTALPTSNLGNNGRCDDGPAGVSNEAIQALIDANPNYTSVDDIPFAYIPRDHRYRQNTTDDERQALFGSVQLQPNDRLDVTLDYQYSERDQRELRKDLQFGTTQEFVTGLISNPETGVIYSSVSETDINAWTTDFQRLEEYEGYGINLDFALTDSLSLSLDYSYSDTVRTETDVELRLGARNDNLVGGSRSDFPVRLDVNQGSGAALATILDNGGNGFEVTDPSYFTGRDRGRLRARQIIRNNTLDALRMDLKWMRDSSAIHTVKAGVRTYSMEYLSLGGSNNDPGVSLFEDEDLVTPDGNADPVVTDAILANVLACADQSFPESGFLSNVRDGELVTNASSGTAVSEFATFDFNCAANAWLVNYGGLAGLEYQNGINAASNDVTEDTLAFYIQADYEAEFAGYPIRGNFGVRFVDTDITSVGYRGPITVEEIDGVGFVVSEGDPGVEGYETDTQKSDYQEVLPSLTVIMDLDDDLILRGGIFRGMSRPDPDAYGNGRVIRDNDNNSAYATLEQAVNGISASGNPYLAPILSTNVDLGLEWYANIDTMIAGAIYWKEFNGGYENVAQLETFDLDGNDVQGWISTTQISDDNSTIKGFELTLTHSFSYLPGFLSGFGGKISYNYADSNFEFEDQYGGDGVRVDVDQAGVATEIPLIGILPPANITGLSKHVSSTQLYWENDKWNIEAFYRTRSGYYQQFARDTQGRIRYTNDEVTLDLKVRYKLFDNVDLNLEAKNITDEPRIDYRGVEGNVLQALSYGPRIFLGVKAKF